MYFGIVSLSGTQLFERVKLLFIPYKYCPNMPYANGVMITFCLVIIMDYLISLLKILLFIKIRPSKRNIFTLIQITAVVILLAFKSNSNISFFFPIFLIALVPFRNYILTKIFTIRELEQV